MNTQSRGDSRVSVESEEKNSLQHLTNPSWTRKESLQIFHNNCRTLGEINGHLNSVSSAVIPQPRKLQKAGLVERQGERYGLTGNGRPAIRSLGAHLKQLDLLDTCEESWRTHDFEALGFTVLP